MLRTEPKFRLRSDPRLPIEDEPEDGMFWIVLVVFCCGVFWTLGIQKLVEVLR